MNKFNQLKPYLRPWIPSIKKVAFAKSVTLSDQQVIDILFKADKYLYDTDIFNYVRQTIRPERIAFAIKQVCSSYLDSMEGVSKVRKSLFMSDNLPHFLKNKVIPKNVYSTLYARD